MSLEIATPIGEGCRKEGPHGPDPCQPIKNEPECACGCAAYEEACDTYLAWYNLTRRETEQ